MGWPRPVLVKQPLYQFWVWLVTITQLIAQTKPTCLTILCKGKVRSNIKIFQSGLLSCIHPSITSIFVHAIKQVTLEQPAHWDCSNVFQFWISDHKLQVLAYFTHVFTLPFLYFVEVNSQNGLLEMFPCLFNYLKCSTTDTLKEYRVKYPHVQVTQPTSNLAQQLLEKMYEDTATALEWQAGQEYGFGERVYATPRATQLHILSLEDHAGLISNNLDVECHLTGFGKRATFAKFCNKKFIAKGIRNDVTLFQSATFKNEQSKGFTSIVKLLNDMEKDWVNQQKQFQQLKTLEKIQSMYMQ